MIALLTLLTAATLAEDAVSCGAACVYLLARESGRPISLDDAKSTLPDAPQGHSFGDLRQALSIHGVTASVTNVGGRSLPKGPFIAHFNSAGGDSIGHFVFFRPLEPTFTQYQMIAPPLEPEVVEAAELLARSDFSGWVMTQSSANWNFAVGGGFLVAGLVLYGATSRNAKNRSPSARG